MCSRFATDLIAAVGPLMSVPCAGEQLSDSGAPAFRPSGVAPQQHPVDDVSGHWRDVGDIASAGAGLVAAELLDHGVQTILGQVIHLGIVISILGGAKAQLLDLRTAGTGGGVFIICLDGMLQLSHRDDLIVEYELLDGGNRVCHARDTHIGGIHHPVSIDGASTIDSPCPLAMQSLVREERYGQGRCLMWASTSGRTCMNMILVKLRTWSEKAGHHVVKAVPLQHVSAARCQRGAGGGVSSRTSSSPGACPRSRREPAMPSVPFPPKAISEQPMTL